MASTSINLGLSREACEGAWRPPSLRTARFSCPRVRSSFRCWTKGLLPSLILLALITSFVSVEAEPLYAGKALGNWLDSGHEDACQAVHEIGLPALPYIIGKLAKEDPRFGSNSSYAGIYARLPLTLRRLLSKPGPTNFDENRASSLLVELGPAAIPLLAEALHSTNPAVREVSAHVLGLMGERGKNIRIAIPTLRAVSRDPCPEVASRAKWALETYFGFAP